MRRAAARAAAERLGDPATVAVVTGQQAGAFGGPLFTLLKAVTAIQLARRVSADQGVSAVAVFWVDAEDHDWEEVRSCTVLDADFQPASVTLADPQGAGEFPVAALTLDERIEQSLAALSDCLPDTDFSGMVLASLRTAYQPGTGMAAAFAKWIETLLGPYGLVVFESADPAAKQLAAPVFLRELRDPGRTSSLALAAGQQLHDRGHEPQVMPQPDSLALFHLNGARRAIRRQGEHFVIGDSQVTAAALVRRRRPIRHTSARTCFFVRSSRTRCFRPSVTSRDRVSSPTSGSSGGCTATSAFRCRSIYRAAAPHSSIHQPRDFSAATTSLSRTCGRRTNRGSIGCCSHSSHPRSSSR